MRHFHTSLLLALGLLGCGEDDAPGSAAATSCSDFCRAIPCPAESAGCDTGGQCACYGCQGFYDKYYSTTDNTAPRCPSE